MAIHWKSTLNVADVFHNDDLTIQQKRDTIVARIRRALYYDADDDDLFMTVESLADAENEDEFDEAWAMLYDWADWDHRLWIVTQG